MAAFAGARTNRARITAQKNLARAEEVNLVAAINAYYADYSRLPASSNAVAAAGPNDFTFGTVSQNAPSGSGPTPAIVVDTPGENTYQNNNSEVIAILRDDAFWPETNNVAQHIYNTKQADYFTAKVALDTSSLRHRAGRCYLARSVGKPLPIITLDLNYDDKCYDATLDGYAPIGNAKANAYFLCWCQTRRWSGPSGPMKTINFGQALNSNYTNKQTIVYSF